MYINEHPGLRYYTRDGGQRTRGSDFLILVQRDMTKELEMCSVCNGHAWYWNRLDDCTLWHPPLIAARWQPCGSCEGTGKRLRYVHHREIRALVRKVSLHQVGHFMMGVAYAFGHRIPISGSYGSDGLPRTVDDDVFEMAVPIPPELHEAWNNGGGWNSAGSEGPAMAQWARDNIDRLKPRRGRKRA